MITADGDTEDATTACWDMIEVNSDNNKERGLEWRSAQSEPQEVRGWEENRWEESSLARFNHFLGFLTERLEKEILDFLIQECGRWFCLGVHGSLWSVHLKKKGNACRRSLGRLEEFGKNPGV
ncbi:hypothetical protein CK203_106458 [Vitis vinifera]|uniref:Uncharacterized protein n=1 Tax=Vitis vinifera TaxID=29760 RepID=A0A438CAM2_VITVI|nr:hypothetical protein CK203_106458 [Vitis vinifera]